MAVLPAVRLEVAFVANPTGTLVWTDVSSYLRLSEGGTVKRAGRQYELDQVEPGRLSVVLRNDDGRFSPGKSTSPYYPYVIPGRPIRITATWLGVAVTLFTGFVDSWGGSWPSKYAARNLVQVTATDRGKQMSRHELRSQIEEHTLSLSPLAYYPLTEAGGASAAGDATGTAHPDLLVKTKGDAGIVAFASELPLLGADGQGGYAVDQPDTLASGRRAGSHLFGTLATPVDINGNFTVSMWVIVPEFHVLSGQPSGLVRLGAQASASFGPFQILVSMISAGTVDVLMGSGGSGGSRRVDDAKLHHVLVTVANAGGSNRTISIWVDGTLDTQNTVAVTTIPADSGDVYLGNGFTFIGSPSVGVLANHFEGTLGHFAVWNSVLSAPTIETIYRVGTAGLPQEHTGARLSRIAAYAGVLGGTYDVGLSNLGSQSLAGRSVSELFAELMAVEAGAAYFGADGAPRLHSRGRRRNADPAFTLDANQGQVSDMDFSTDDDRLVNDLSYTGAGGAVGRVVNQASIDKFGRFRGSLDLPLTTPFEASQRAQGHVLTYGDPRPRSQTIEVDPLANPALFPEMLAADLSQRFDTTNLPANAPSPAMSWIVEAVEHTFSHKSWKTSLQASPYDSTRYFQLDHPTYGRLDAGNLVGW